MMNYIDDTISFSDIAVLKACDTKFLVTKSFYDNGKYTTSIQCAIFDDVETAWTYIEQLVYQYYGIANPSDLIGKIYVKIDLNNVTIIDNTHDFIKYSILQIPYIYMN